MTLDNFGGHKMKQETLIPTISTDGNKNVIDCPVCKGTGKLSWDRLAKDLGMAHIADVSRMTIQEIIKKFNTDGLRIYEEISKKAKEDYEKRFCQGKLCLIAF